MTVSEFGFLAMGLVLGIASGAALIEIFRTRPPAPREVKLTVAADAVPRRRAATLADETFAGRTIEPARGSPAELIDDGVDGTGLASNGRTPVRSGPRPRRVIEPVFRLVDPRSLGGQAARVGMSIDSGLDPMLAALRASAIARFMQPSTVSPSASGVTSASTGAATATATAERPMAAGRKDAGRGPADRGDLASLSASVADERETTPSGSCADERRLAEERCELATRARAQAATAEEALRIAQRAYDDHESRADAASRAADPRAVRSAKDEAQARFRAGRSAAQTTDAVEAAARAWLTEINEINTDAREAVALAAREREAARVIGATLERTSLEADAARIAAEGAEAACLQARQAVADCEERETSDTGAGPVGHEPRFPSGAPDAPNDLDRVLPDRPGGLAPDRQDEPLALAFGEGGTPRIFRLLRGDRSALVELVDVVAGDDPTERKRWQTGLADLVDAILADSIEASILDFPTEHPFWGPFSRSQGREITAALSSLGYRFDGRGGWVDERFPSQRDLSLALGYAGLDPMRMRHWPDEREMIDLFADVTVAADEHLATHAGDLTLGELVTMLGRRADGLTEIWNAWGRLRPLLLEDA